MLPRVVLHNAVSIDGRIDGFTPDLGLYYGLIPRWAEDATLVGTETVLAADLGAPEEEETEDPPPVSAGDRRPLLVIPDSRGRVRAWDRLRKQPYWRDAVSLCSRSTPLEHLAYLSERRVDHIVAGEDKVDLRAALEELNIRYGVKVVRADTGGMLNGALLQAGLVDEVSLLIAPCLVGSSTPKSIFQLPDELKKGIEIPARLMHLERMAGDWVWLRYELAK
ncbi:MAG TPA: RibD family protein [Chloroflexota bacterium]|nr:RibD family protein [Chloroflexota bacterium]